MVYLFIRNYFLNTEEQNTYFKRPLDSHVTRNTFPAVLSACWFFLKSLLLVIEWGQSKDFQGIWNVVSGPNLFVHISISIEKGGTGD